MSVTVYSYFNVNQVAALFDSIAAITASADYLDIVKIVMMISFLVLVVGMAVGKAQDPFEFFRWLIIVSLINGVLLIPKTTVLIVDRTGSVLVAPRQNIPIGLAFFASVTSHVGDALTRAFEGVFAMPNDLKFQQNGIMFGNTVLTNALQAQPNSPAFRDDMGKFIINCTYYDILAGYISTDQLSITDDVWTMLSNTSLTHMTPNSTSSTGSMACNDAYLNISNRFPAEITSKLETMGRTLNPQAANNAVAAAMLDSEVPAAFTTLTGISKTSADILRQNMAINAVRDSQTVSAQMLNADSSAIINAAQTQVEYTTNINYMTMARIAERAAPAIRNVVEIICYAVFPLVILLMILAGEHTGKLLKGYVMTLIWIQLIPPLYAVLNFVMTSVSGTSLVGISTSWPGATNTVVNLIDIGKLSQQGISDMAIAGYLTLSIPIIAWALVKSGEIGGAALFSAAFSGASSSAGHVAGNLAAGNISQGNVSLDNVNANKYDSAPQHNSGYANIGDAQGRSTYGKGGELISRNTNLSSIGFDASMGQKIANTMSADARASQEVTKRESDAATTMKTASLVTRMGLVRAYADQHGTNNLDDATQGSRSAQTVAKMEQIAESVNQRLGLDAKHEVGQKIVGTLSTGGQIGFNIKGIASGNVGATSNLVNEAGRQKTFDAAIGYAKDALKSNNISSDVALSKDFRSSNAFQWGKQNRIESIKADEASLTSATQHTHNADKARQEAFALSESARVVKENWATSSVTYANYITSRMGNNHDELNRYETALRENPEKAARMASKYLMEILPTTPPTPPTSDLQKLQQGSSALSGKTIASENERFGTPPDTTGAANAQNQMRVKSAGWTPPQKIENTVAPQVRAAGENNQQAISAAGSDVSNQVGVAKKEAAGSLDQKTMGPGMNATGSGEAKTAAQIEERVSNNTLFKKK